MLLAAKNTNVQNYPNVEYINDNHNGTHRDYIQLMVNSKAKDFGYLNSETSQTVSDHYTLVDGSVIDEWAKNMVIILEKVSRDVPS